MAKTKAEISISLTDFIDFVSKAGGTKMTKVKEIKNRPDYHPATDFYKAFREKVIEIHENNGNKNDLDKILKELTHDAKKKNYPLAVAGYKKFWGKKKIGWFRPPSKHWINGNVDIHINPELGLDYDGKLIVVKMYLKADKLTKDKVTQILSLMEDQLRKKVPEEVLFCVLDVKNAKLFCNEAKDTSMLPLLKGEVINFETIWKSL